MFFVGITLLLTGVVGGTEAGVHPWGALQAGSNYTWLQTDWSGGADTIHFPVYPANMIGWTKFYSKGPGITAGTELTLTPTPGSITQTTDLDFLAGTLVAVAISGVGTAAEVRLARAVAVWTHLSSNWLLVDVGIDAAPAFADIDNDGDFDLAVGDGTGRVEFFENTGTATSPIWTHRSSDWLPVDVGIDAAPAFADIDND
ncbi:VCBS repeat-containing protein, partial [Candidatus Acetothermia bacterium]|nr:VCBS repeat-containing protein [Candidatus Acetothermia bacterium]